VGQNKAAADLQHLQCGTAVSTAVARVCLPFHHQSFTCGASNASFYQLSNKDGMGMAVNTATHYLPGRSLAAVQDY
jgi:hypothetical protein